MKFRQILHYGYLRFLMQKPVQTILHSVGHDLKPEKWVFILGCYNSATTLLASILRKHPSVGGLVNEGAFHTDVLPYPELFGWPRMWCRCLDDMQFDADSDLDMLSNRIKRQWSLLFPKNTPVLIEKSISNITRTQFLQDYFKPAYFIYIVRNGYVVSKGIQQKTNYSRWKSPYQHSGYPIELCAEQWKQSDDIVTRSKENLKRFYTIRYEDFVEAPHHMLKELTDFLEIEAMPASVLEDEWQIHEVNSSIVNMNPVGLKRLEEDDFQRIESVAKDVLKKYGYTREG